MKCTIYLFQTTLEGIQYNNSYFWYLKKKLEHNVGLEHKCFLGHCVNYLVYFRDGISHLQFSSVVLMLCLDRLKADYCKNAINKSVVYLC